MPAPNARKRFVAIITAGLSVAIGLLYLVLISVLDARGPLLPPPLEALGGAGVADASAVEEVPQPVAMPSPGSS